MPYTTEYFLKAQENLYHNSKGRVADLRRLTWCKLTAPRAGITPGWDQTYTRVATHGLQNNAQVLLPTAAATLAKHIMLNTFQIIKTDIAPWKKKKLSSLLWKWYSESKMKKLSGQLNTNSSVY